MTADERPRLKAFWKGGAGLEKELSPTENIFRRWMAFEQLQLRRQLIWSPEIIAVEKRYELPTRGCKSHVPGMRKSDPVLRNTNSSRVGPRDGRAIVARVAVNNDDFVIGKTLRGDAGKRLRKETLRILDRYDY